MTERWESGHGKPCPYCNTSSNLVVSVRRTANGRPYESFSDFVSIQSERSVIIAKPYLACPEREGGPLQRWKGFNSTLHSSHSTLEKKADGQWPPLRCYFLCSSCGSQSSLRLGAPMNFDRCAIITSLHLPPEALQ